MFFLIYMHQNILKYVLYKKTLPKRNLLKISLFAPAPNNVGLGVKCVLWVRKRAPPWKKQPPSHTFMTFYTFTINLKKNKPVKTGKKYFFSGN